LRKCGIVVARPAIASLKSARNDRPRNDDTAFTQRRVRKQVIDLAESLKILFHLKNSPHFFRYNNQIILRTESAAMKRNKAILAELMKNLEEIKTRIKRKKLNLYNHELNQLQEIIGQSLKITHRSSYFEKNDVVKCIMKMIHVIDSEIETIEIEMRGVGNYSSYESARVDEMVFKQAIKDDLNVMLHLLIQARPEVRDTELSGMVKMLEFF